MIKSNIFDFIEKANKKHGKKYDYSKSEYINAKTNLIIICKDHGEFKQRPNNHLNGDKCPACALVLSRATLEDFISKANLKHKFKYNYSKTIYIKSKSKVIIICKEHGDFKQSPAAHLSGKGCVKCSGKYKPSTKEFAAKANLKHNFKYKYSKSKYINSGTKIIIICKIHGEFEQSPHLHLRGAGCNKCTSTISKIEIKWLNYLNVPEKYRQQTILVNNKKYKLDAYNPKTNTVYEFNGDYWHGNPKIYNLNDLNNHNKKTFRFLYNKTIQKEKHLIKSGFNVISIWESDFRALLNDSDHLTKKVK